MRAPSRFPIKAAAVFVAIGLAFSRATPAAAQPRAIDAQRSTITIHVFKSGLFRAFADNHLIQGPVAAGVIDDSAAPKVHLVINADRLRVLDPGLSPGDREHVQARMLGGEVLDRARFPEIRFQSKIVERADADGWLVRGDLELHGQVHQVAVKVTREHGHYTGRTTLRQTDFGITPVSVAGGTVKVKDEITIDFDIVTVDR